MFQTEITIKTNIVDIHQFLKMNETEAKEKLTKWLSHYEGFSLDYSNFIVGKFIFKHNTETNPYSDEESKRLRKICSAWFEMQRIKIEKVSIYSQYI